MVSLQSVQVQYLIMKLVWCAVFVHCYLVYKLWDLVELDSVSTLKIQHDYLELPDTWPLPSVIVSVYHYYIAWNIVNFVDDVVPTLQNAIPLIVYTLGVLFHNPVNLQLLFLQCVWHALYFGHWRNKLVMHHLVTGTLLFLSLTYRYVSVGIFVIYVHSISDIPMYLLRHIRRYTANKTWQIPLVVWTVISWVYYRLWLMGCLVYQCFYFVHLVPQEQHVWAYTCIGALIVLLCLNLFWWVLLMRKCVKELYYGYDQTLHDE